MYSCPQYIFVSIGKFFNLFKELNICSYVPSKTLPNSWYDTPNLHMCSIKDLFHFCIEKNIEIKRAIGINEDKTSEIKKSNLEIKNFYSKLGIFLIG